MKPHTFIAVAAGAVLVLAGCARGSGSQSSTPPSHEPGSVYQLPDLPENTVESRPSLARLYANVDQVANESVAAVLGLAGAQRVTDETGLPHTVTTIRVDDVLAGDIGSSEVNIRNLGPLDAGPQSEVVTPSLPSIPTTGLTYLLMLEPYAPGGIDTGDFIVTGPGQWVREFDDQRFALDLRDHGLLRPDHTVPLDVSVDELRNELDRIWH